MANIYLIDLEDVPTRYTGQWKTHIPNLLTKEGHYVYPISGSNNIPNSTTPGAFLNFGGTNIYKASQVEELGRLFCSGSIKPGDHFLFTDAWHPGIVNLKYMSELLQVPVVIHALWHAGSYDPQDFLGRLIGDEPWVRHAEKSFYYAIDHNYFATDFHINMFCENLLEQHPDAVKCYDEEKVIRTGWPMEYMHAELANFKNMEKKDLILFPHRIAHEKQPDIFMDLEKQLPQYEFVVCQEKNLSKYDYHVLLGQSKIVFSANLQETLGISCYEGTVVDSIPMVPNRLSYQEMYFEEFKYPSDWTINYSSYESHRTEICNKIVDFIENYESYKPLIKSQSEILSGQFFSSTNLVQQLNR